MYCNNDSFVSAFAPPVAIDASLNASAARLSVTVVAALLAIAPGAT
jgi:hypothetical protein